MISSPENRVPIVRASYRTRTAGRGTVPHMRSYYMDIKWLYQSGTRSRTMEIHDSRPVDYRWHIMNELYGLILLHPLQVVMGTNTVNWYPGSCYQCPDIALQEYSHFVDSGSWKRLGGGTVWAFGGMGFTPSWLLLIVALGKPLY